MKEIIKEFESFMSENGTHCSQFYVGIASDPEDRLINGHGVSEDTPYIYWNESLDTDMVRAIEKYFLDKGAKGGPGGGDDSTRYIYAYLITPETRE